MIPSHKVNGHQSQSSTPSAKGIRFARRDSLSRAALVWRFLPKPLGLEATRCTRFWCALRREVRSCRGRIRTLLAKKHWGVDLGLEFQCSPDGCLVDNECTKGRSLGIEALVKAYPWASTIDLQIFLEGVHAGERSALRILGFDSDKQVLAAAALEPIETPETGNFIALQASQQSANRDPLAPKSAGGI